MKNIVVVDDHPIFREGVKYIIKKTYDFNIFDASNFPELLNILEKYSITLITLDINLPDKDGFEILKFLKKEYPEIKILIISMYSNHLIVKKAKDMGVDGYISKEELTDNLIIAIKKILKGEKFFIEDDSLQESEIAVKANKYFLLTNAEKEVFRFLAAGKHTKEIALILNKSFKTVANQKTSIFEKMNIQNPLELIKIADLLEINKKI